jgi:hypothetical protein
MVSLLEVSAKDVRGIERLMMEREKIWRALGLYLDRAPRLVILLTPAVRTSNHPSAEMLEPSFSR